MPDARDTAEYYDEFGYPRRSATDRAVAEEREPAVGRARCRECGEPIMLPRYVYCLGHWGELPRVVADRLWQLWGTERFDQIVAECDAILKGEA